MSKNEVKTEQNKFIRFLWITLGSIFVAIGYIGIFVPGLPTTIFLILAAGCYIRSSKRLYNWLIHNKLFGQYIRDYYEGKGMPLKAKVSAISMIIIFCGFAIIFAIKPTWLDILVTLVGLTGIYYISRRVPTKK
ncbi:MAG: YbaN family protein [Chloroflexota bacterium]|nr:YbaN family protein [Chloroflexota bacterium]